MSVIVKSEPLVEEEESILVLKTTSDLQSLGDEDKILLQDSDESVLLTGQMIKLEDGTTALLDITPDETNDSEQLTPYRLEDGTVLYLAPDSILSSILQDSNMKIEPDITNSIETVSTPTENKGFECTFAHCRKSYTSLHHLRVHMRVHTGDKPFKCVVEGCSKSFSTNFGLKTHTRTHNGERPYVCTYGLCEKSFKTSGDLQKHIRTHTGERPFVCPVPECGRSFTTCNICKVHIRTHTGERPYKCTYENCNKTFSSVTNHRNHLRIHSGEKPYQCSVPNCNRRFTEYSSLYKHNMVHRQGEYKCVECDKQYRTASSLSMHMKTYHTAQEPLNQFLVIENVGEEEILTDTLLQTRFTEADIITN